MYLLLSYYLVLCRHSFVKTFAQLQVQPVSLSAFPRQEDNADIHKGIKVNV
jgi:hypothetical protein